VGTLQAQALSPLKGGLGEFCAVSAPVSSIFSRIFGIHCVVSWSKELSGAELRSRRYREKPEELWQTFGIGRRITGEEQKNGRRILPMAHNVLGKLTANEADTQPASGCPTHASQLKLL
jgi:hypothetical protein